MASDLNELVDKLSSTFDKCLGNALSDTSKEEKDKLDVTILKQCFIDLQYQLKSISLASIQQKPLSVKESIAALEKDIAIKQQTIEKYNGKIEHWLTVLPELERQSRQVLNTNQLPPPPTPPTSSPAPPAAAADLPPRDSATPVEATSHLNHEDDDDDDDMEFEDVS
ncbi:hypothetical protein DM01DRAFT_1382741 [Hesseltinella vesiculosa]|uniref:Uncharacterized protein n=1 Tax=Hesseltinella vesiculosa TaxID=101127 RepID=A0A1X2GJX3_9FUNG|nr:hypothetical protein DM01DRAFT_1382741 [Hesseltinella vesiculosa]